MIRYIAGIVDWTIAELEDLSKIYNKAKLHNYVPLDKKTITKIKKKHRAWQRYMESREGGNIGNM